MPVRCPMLGTAESAKSPPSSMPLRRYQEPEPQAPDPRTWPALHLSSEQPLQGSHLAGWPPRPRLLPLPQLLPLPLLPLLPLRQGLDQTLLLLVHVRGQCLEQPPKLALRR